MLSTTDSGGTISLDDDLDAYDIAPELDRDYTGDIDRGELDFWIGELDGLEQSYGYAASTEASAATAIKAALNLHLDVEAYCASAIDELEDEYSDLEEELEPFYDPRDDDSGTDTDSIYVRITPR